METMGNKEPFRYVVDQSQKIFRVDRDELGIFAAEEVTTGEKRLVTALDLESCRDATHQELEELGITIE